MVDGVRIVIYPDDHAPPHFHAWKDGREAKFAIETGELIGGALDRRSLRKVQQWSALNGDLLMMVWEATRTGSTETTTS
ncbi:DUF4160 domain-containing protein [Sphingomonas bacterium]|uniref:DUF4160 domain-containing protein n=1 Tax=Sphingomonas bacterium TaxID=1895847 RepID=UPI0034A09A96